jgi:hypothetical protein
MGPERRQAAMRVAAEEVAEMAVATLAVLAKVEET